MSHWRQTQELFSGEGDKCSCGSVASVSRHPPPIPTPSLRSPGPARPATLSYVSNSENLRICQSKVFQRLRDWAWLVQEESLSAQVWSLPSQPWIAPAQDFFLLSAAQMTLPWVWPVWPGPPQNGGKERRMVDSSSLTGLGWGWPMCRGSDPLFSGLILPCVLNLLRYLQALQHHGPSRGIKP